jgi:mannose-6-phosphate isomerase-like protein (cupin superfamily)
MAQTTTTNETRVETVTLGRLLVDGVPSGEGLTLAADSPTLAVLRDAVTPLVGNPVLGEYGAGLELAESTGGESARGIGITLPGRGAPDEHEHVHPSYDEHFEVVEGEFVFVLDGEATTLRAGEAVTVPKGTPHTYRNESDAVASCLIETRPAGRIAEVLYTLCGLGLDGKLDEDGNPRFLQAMVMAEELSDDTVFTAPPPAVQRLLATVVAPFARVLGFRATYVKYETDDFWATRVEQPPP